MAALSWEYAGGSQIIISVILCGPPDRSGRSGTMETRSLIVDTGTNAGLVLLAEDYDRFAWAHLKQATMRGAGTGVVRTGWGMVGIGPEAAEGTRQVLICDGGERLRELYDAAGARLGLPEGQVAGQAGMAFLDSFGGWSSRGGPSRRTFTIEP